MDTNYDLDSVIRKVPDFPKQGVLYYDITGILAVPEAFRYCIDRLEALSRGRNIDAIAAIEARGFVFAAPLAERLSLPLILVRKPGKLPNKTYKKRFDLVPGTNVLLVDDLIATGGTLQAAAAMFKEHGAHVEGFLGVIGLPFLDYEKNLEGHPVDVLQVYHGE